MGGDFAKTEKSPTTLGSERYTVKRLSIQCCRQSFYMNKKQYMGIFKNIYTIYCVFG